MTVNALELVSCFLNYRSRVRFAPRPLSNSAHFRGFCARIPAAQSPSYPHVVDASATVPTVAGTGAGAPERERTGILTEARRTVRP